MKTFIQNQKRSIAKNSIRLVLLLSIGLLASCNEGDDDQIQLPVYTPPAGVADITLTTVPGGTEFKLIGPCGWAVAGGVNYIGANHAENSNRVFSAGFNINTLPTVTTTYTLVDYDVNDTDPTHITMDLTQVNGSNFTEWTSYNGSGTLTLTVNGNEITANLAGITLEHGTGAGNAAPYNQDGTLSGTLKFYR